MEKIIVLGTAGAVTNSMRDNVSLVFTTGDLHLLIECGGSAAHKLARAGITYEALEHIIITHTHTDHVYGLPGLIFSMRYRDVHRTTPLRIYCPDGAAQEIEALLGCFGLRDKSYFPVEIQSVPFQENALMLEDEQVIVSSTPVDHVPDMPTYGIKIVSRTSKKTIVYSSDTGPSERLFRLADHADILFHECAGLAEHPIPEIHSNARQVGEVARKSRARKLVLLHLDTVLDDDPQAIIAQVKENFEGEVVIASDFDVYVL